MNLPPHDPDLVVPTDGYFDPDASNGLRARSAREAMLYYRRERGFDEDDHVCAVDLLTDLLHFIHSMGESPLDALEKARGHFIAEATDTAPLIIG